MAKFLCTVVVLGIFALSHTSWAQDADPTRPAVRSQQVISADVDVHEYRLSSVWYRASNAEKRSSAVINDQRFEEGDEVGSYVVEAIEPGQVLLKNDDGEMWLRVFRSNNITIEPSRG